LLNDKLGGPGSWTNLTALSRTGNSEHESSVESLVKAAFDAGAVIHYTVESKGNLPVTEPAESDKPRFVKVADINASFPIIKKIIHAEKQVCQELKCVAYTMKKEGTAWVNDTLIVDKTVTNSIETAYESYELGEDVQPPTVNLNSALTDQLERLSAIGAAKAQAIIIYRSDPANLLSSGKYFDKVEDLSKVEGVGAATIASLKNDKLVVT
jgi:competence ComEA-like helix-hairpin-helix protein